MSDKDFKNNSQTIREKKIAIMKKIFKDQGEEISLYANILTGDELVKCFDYFKRNVNINSENADNTNKWSVFLKIISEEFLSIKTKKLLKECKKS